MLQFGREIAPSVSWEILAHVKRTGGISVNELAALLKMSYMGVKQHCDALKRRGYLDTWRRPKATGRPEKIFRPTLKLDLILPNWGNELCFNILAYSAEVMGETAPERLLHSFLQQKSEQWAAKLKGKSLVERARQFVKIRNSEGWICELVEEPNQLLIIEHHSPLNELAKLYPAIWTIETRALEHCFQVEGEITRDEINGRSQLILPASGFEPKTEVQPEAKSKSKTATLKADEPKNQAAKAPARVEPSQPVVAIFKPDLIIESEPVSESESEPIAEIEPSSLISESALVEEKSVQISELAAQTPTFTSESVVTSDPSDLFVEKEPLDLHEPTQKPVISEDESKSNSSQTSDDHKKTTTPVSKRRGKTQARAQELLFDFD